MRVLAQLITPARYLRIRSESKEKLVIDVCLPLLLAVATTVVWSLKPEFLRMSGSGGLASAISSLIQVLVGFYVATLAAVATFPASSLDEDTNRLTLDGKAIKRRRFLAYLFGYLALLSLALFLAVLFRPLAEGMLDLLSREAERWGRIGLVFLYQTIFWQMVLITLLGLHYLTDRIHRSNNE